MNRIDDLGASIFQGRANRIETERLIIAPLTREESELYLTDVDAFARALRLAKAPDEPDEGTKRALNWLIDQSLQYDKNSSVWTAIWAFIDKRENVVVGNACFKGAPINGDAEIGYGTERQFQNRGYMTEGVRGLVSWGRQRNDLRGIVAETLKDNIPSQRVLESAGFVQLGDGKNEKDAFFWRVDVK